jgi:hypothetical protein
MLNPRIKRKCSLVQDVRTMRRLNCESDHHLVKTAVKQNLITVSKKQTYKIKSKLKQDTQYLHNASESKKEKQDIHIEWKHIKKSILEAANAVIQPQGGKTYNEWWADVCRAAVKRKYANKVAKERKTNG